jgi:hypothetical protein
MVRAIIWQPGDPLQSGAFVADGARSVVVHIGTRRENLLGAQIGHWLVTDSRPHGFWLCSCVSCGCSREVRLDGSQTHCPPCRSCEDGHSTIAQMRADRSAHLNRAKYLRRA